MKYTLPKSYSNAGKVIDIDDAWLKAKRSELGSTKMAIDTYLVENGLMRADEYEVEKGSIVIEPKKKRSRKPNDVKRELIDCLFHSLLDADKPEGVTITNEERTIIFSIGNDHYEITLSKKRKPKA